MIDDYQKTMKLIKDIEENLPIFAYPAKNLVHSLRDNNDEKIKAKEKLKPNPVGEFLGGLRLNTMRKAS